MLGIDELKRHIEVTEMSVECPVLRCTEKVSRQRVYFKRESRFQCPKHRIYISPTTFEYQRETDNLLWTDESDLRLLDRIKRVKRESRMARDNSEDAVTWNIFRFLERNRLMEDVLGSLTGADLASAHIVYWSYSQTESSSYRQLDRARKEFGEEANRGSEPDIIVESPNAVLFIEAKLTAGNETLPSDRSNPKMYETGADGWFSKVFKSDYDSILNDKKYELMRFWLLGSWIATQTDVPFYLVNLTLGARETDIESIMHTHLQEHKRARFIRITWEGLFKQIAARATGPDQDVIVRYFRNKTIGYDASGDLQFAFSLGPEVPSKSRLD